MSNNAIIATYAVIVVLAVLLAIVFFAYQPVLVSPGRVLGTTTESSINVGVDNDSGAASTSTATTSGN